MRLHKKDLEIVISALNGMTYKQVAERFNCSATWVNAKVYEVWYSVLPHSLKTKIEKYCDGYTNKPLTMMRQYNDIVIDYLKSDPYENVAKAIMQGEGEPELIKSVLEYNFPRSGHG